MEMVARILGALTFKPGIYAEVKKDASFTGSAWLIVVVTSLLFALGSNTSLLRSGRVGSWFLGVIGTALFMVLDFTLTCILIRWLGKTVFNTSAKFEQLVRPFGLARVWMAISFVGILTVLSPTLACVTGMAGLAAILLWFLAWVIAAKETLGLDLLQSISVGFIGMFVMVGISLLSNTVLGLLGLVGSSL
jgi:hypothetical protein